MGLDLTRLQAPIANLICVDRCTVWRDPEGTTDDVLDPDSLSYEPAADAVAVETDLPFAYAHRNQAPQLGEAGQPLVIGEYNLSFAQPEADIRNGDRIEVTESRHNPSAEGVFFLVVEVTHATFAVLKQARGVLRAEGVERP